MKTLFKKHWFQFTSIFFAIFFLAALYTFWRQSSVWPEAIMAKHIKELQAVFIRINETAGILNFEHQKNFIDFLNVRSFEGSEVGSMNLIDATKWEGPYFNDNPTIQEKYYQVVQTKDGYFIVPGPGVQMANGMIIGKDIIFDENANIGSMIMDPDQLNFKGKPLAAPIPIGHKKPHEAFKIPWPKDY